MRRCGDACALPPTPSAVFAAQNPALSCANQGLVRRPQVDDGPVPALSDLIVSNRLVTSQQSGGTLELAGGAGRDPDEAALYVAKGARFDGLTQHGRARVLGDLTVGGTSTLPVLTGLTQVLLPYGAAATDTALAVEGVTLIGDLRANSSEVTLSSSLLAFVGTNGTAPLAAGALAPAEVLAYVGSRVVVLLDTSGSYQMLGYAVDASTVICPYSWLYACTADVASAATVDSFSNHPAGLVYNVLNSGGTLLKQANVFTNPWLLGTMQAGNMAVLDVSPDGAPFPACPLDPVSGRPAYSQLVADYVDQADTPLTGMQVLVLYYDQATETLQQSLGVVSDASFQMFGNYTSLNVTLTGSPGGGDGLLPPGSTGGLVFDMGGKLLAVIQHGVRGCTPTAPSTPLAFVGGVKGRYINYMLNYLLAADDLPLPQLQDAASPHDPVDLPGIPNSARLASLDAALKPGGVVKPTDALTVTTQKLGVVKLGTPTPQAVAAMGTYTFNTPSATDTFLAMVGEGLWTGTQQTLTNGDAGSGDLCGMATGSYSRPDCGPLVFPALFGPSSIALWSPGQGSPTELAQFAGVRTTRFMACQNYGGLYYRNSTAMHNQFALTPDGPPFCSVTNQNQHCVDLTPSGLNTCPADEAFCVVHANFGQGTNTVAPVRGEVQSYFLFGGPVAVDQYVLHTLQGEASTAWGPATASLRSQGKLVPPQADANSLVALGYRLKTTGVFKWFLLYDVKARFAKDQDGVPTYSFQIGSDAGTPTSPTNARFLNFVGYVLGGDDIQFDAYRLNCSWFTHVSSAGGPAANKLSFYTPPDLGPPTSDYAFISWQGAGLDGAYRQGFTTSFPAGPLV